MTKKNFFRTSPNSLIDLVSQIVLTKAILKIGAESKTSITTAINLVIPLKFVLKKYELTHYLKKGEINNVITDTDKSNGRKLEESEEKKPIIGLSTFIVNQHNAFLALLHQSLPSSSVNIPYFQSLVNTTSGTNIPPSTLAINGNWILDTDATDHVCHCPSYFQSFTTIPIIPIIYVKLPNCVIVTTK